MCKCVYVYVSMLLVYVLCVSACVYELKCGCVSNQGIDGLFNEEEADIYKNVYCVSHQ